METGLFFGTFNPVHIGHMAIANYMAEFVPFREIWFVVSPQSPFKSHETLLPDYQRLELLNLAINDDPRFRTSSIEFTMPKPSYTIDTLAYLGEKYPGRHFSLIMGQDNLAGLHKWKNYQFLLDQYPIWVYPRKGCSENPLISHPNIRFTDAPLLEISASMLRHSIAMGKNMKYFFPEKVWNYITEMNLFCP